MNCPGCGSELAEGAKFCNECGERVTPLPSGRADATISGGATAGSGPLRRSARAPLPHEGPPTPEGTLSGRGTYVPPAGFAITRALERGEPFANRYRVIRPIGAGGMGTVYLAEDEWEHAPVCIKVIRPELVADPEMAARFLREGTLTRRMHHRNIVKVFDVSRFGDSYFIVMEHLPGRSLRAWLREHIATRRDVRPGVAIGIALQILDGLGEAHRQGIVHRDLKPENVMLVAEAPGGGVQLKILDFGIARAVDSVEPLTRTGAVLGTRVYMAPEQETGQEGVGPQADLYSVGVIFYEMLLEVPPAGRWDLPSEIRRDLPTIVDAVCRRALNHHPRRRYADTIEFSDVLRSLLLDVGEAPAPLRDASAEPKRPPKPEGISLPVSEEEVEEALGRLVAGPDWSAPPERRNEEGKLLALHEPTGLLFVLVPGGTYLMGSAAAGLPSEEPVHWVTIPPFLLATTPCTRVAYSLIHGSPIRDPSTADLPVEIVTFERATSWCDAAGGGLRLPSEAEWEHACRAATDTAYSFGDDEARLPDFAWYGWNSDEHAHPVGEKLPNPWGLFDMHGNVWEWCEDRWHESYRGAPGDGSAWIADADAPGRVFRGGSWSSAPSACRSAYRGWAGPDFEGRYLGFRPAASLPLRLDAPTPTVFSEGAAQEGARTRD